MLEYFSKFTHYRNVLSKKKDHFRCIKIFLRKSKDKSKCGKLGTSLVYVYITSFYK